VVAVRVRPAVPADAFELARAHVASWRWAYPGLVPQSYLDALSVEQRARRWAQFIATKERRTATWLARDEQGCCGLASAGPARPDSAGVGELYSIYVLARVAGQGVGHALLGYSVAQLKAMLYGSAMLWVLEDNVRARRFYEREGWSLEGAPRYEQLAGVRLRVVRYQRSL